MKKLLTIASLVVACTSCQQQAKEKTLTKEELVLKEQTITQNRKWGWFKPLEKTAPFMDAGGVWHIKERTTLNDSASTVSFQNSDGNMKVTSIAYNGLIFGHMIVIKHEDDIIREFTNMLTNGVPQDEKGDWVDEQNNAVISFGRQPNGEQVFYRVEYKEFYN